MQHCQGPRGLAAAPIALFFFISAAASAAPAQRFLHVEPSQKRKAALLTSHEKGPGFFRNSGVRGGVPAEDMGELGDSGAKMDAMLNRNILTGASMSYDFRVLDNLEPTAPMDRLHAALGSDSEAGHHLNPVYVPKYLNSEAFPNTHGPGCDCMLPDPKNRSDVIKCTCGDKDAKKGEESQERNHYTWLKDRPVPGTRNFTLEPADITYRSGNYWSPKTRDGLVAPADALPPDQYPNQAMANHIWPLPATARADRLGAKFARYVDQVQDRSEECDTVSKKCTVPCKPGDEVVAVIGNVLADAKVLKTFEGNAVEIEFTPAGALKAEEVTEDCPIEGACSAFRFCKLDNKPFCVEQKDKESKNWAGMLVRKNKCPEGSKACKTVKQVLMASVLKKGDKACRAAAR